MGISFYKDIYGMLSRKYPNRKIYIISDHHFFHSNIIKYGRENFCDVFDMNKQIIFKHNQIIDKEDIVIFLGDFCFKKSAIKPILEQMNGHKFLLLGNHDQPELTRIYGKMGFEGIFTEPVKLDGDYLSHQPLCKEEATNTNFKLLVNEFLKDNINTNYHGHIHTSENISQHHINVSCEATDYMPIAIGYTNGIKDNGALLPINSKHFEHILNLFKEEKNLEPTLLITDYIYSMMLASNKKYSGSIFVYGSFPLYKKYGYISNFSDLDVGLIYNDKVSITKNQQLLKTITNNAFETVKNIDGINLSFIKRIANMCAFEALYTNKLGNIASCIFDFNLVPYNLYRDSDFMVVDDKTILEHFLAKEHPELLVGMQLPRYQAKYLTPNGDMANLILQIIFQKGFDDRKNKALKKLRYVYKLTMSNNVNTIDDLEDILIRFFLRNILFFHTVRRYKEIEYIMEEHINIDKLLDNLPPTFSIKLRDILINPNSEFNLILKELRKMDISEIPEKSKEIILRIK